MREQFYMHVFMYFLSQVNLHTEKCTGLRSIAAEIGKGIHACNQHPSQDVAYFHLSNNFLCVCYQPVITPTGNHGSEFSHHVLSFLEFSTFLCLASLAQQNVFDAHPDCCMPE